MLDHSTVISYIADGHSRHVLNAATPELIVDPGEATVRVSTVCGVVQLAAIDNEFEATSDWEDVPETTFGISSQRYAVRNGSAEGDSVVDFEWRVGPPEEE